MLSTRYTVIIVMLGICYQAGLDSLAILTLVTSFWVLSGGYYTIYLIYHTLPRDLIIAKRFIHLLYSNFSAKWKNQTVGELFLRTAARVPNKVILSFNFIFFTSLILTRQ